jgi:hypothetical protein
VAFWSAVVLVDELEALLQTSYLKKWKTTPCKVGLRKLSLSNDGKTSSEFGLFASCDILSSDLGRMLSRAREIICAKRFWRSHRREEKVSRRLGRLKTHAIFRMRSHIADES